jgi:hypothetical protein
MEFVSLRTIIYDLLNIIRGAKITDDELISERQLENWIHQYRVKLIKQDVDKGKFINPDYVQEYKNSDGSPLAVSPIIQETRVLYRTDVRIPKTIDANFKSGLLYIGDIEGNIIQLIPEQRANYQQYNRYVPNEPLCWLNDRYIYIINYSGNETISIRGIFEVPTEADLSMTLDSKYPIPINALPTLKEMILKSELGIIFSNPNDDSNDGAHENLNSDITGYKQTYRTNRPV